MPEQQIVFWNRTPGKFVNKLTGREISVIVNGQPTFPLFLGNQEEWNETLVETVVDMRNTLHKLAVDELGACAQEAINVRCGKEAWAAITTSVLYPSKGLDHGEMAAMTLQREPEEHGTTYVQDVELLMDAAFVTSDGRRLALQGLVRIL